LKALSPACGGSSPKGGASNISLPLRGRWHAVRRDGEGVCRLYFAIPLSSNSDLIPLSSEEAWGVPAAGSRRCPPRTTWGHLNHEDHTSLVEQESASLSTHPSIRSRIPFSQTHKKKSFPNAFRSQTLCPCPKDFWRFQRTFLKKVLWRSTRQSLVFFTRHDTSTPAPCIFLQNHCNSGAFVL